MCTYTMSWFMEMRRTHSSKGEYPQKVATCRPGWVAFPAFQPRTSNLEIWCLDTYGYPGVGPSPGTLQYSLLFFFVCPCYIQLCVIHAPHCSVRRSHHSVVSAQVHRGEVSTPSWSAGVDHWWGHHQTPTQVWLIVYCTVLKCFYHGNYAHIITVDCMC